jgi:hypothetical protein
VRPLLGLRVRAGDVLRRVRAMSRSRNKSKPRRDWPCGNHGGCPWCEGNRTVQARRAPTVAEQLDSMCDCPNCRVGKEDRCWAGAASELGEDCSICDGSCTGLESRPVSA